VSWLIEKGYFDLCPEGAIRDKLVHLDGLATDAYEIGQSALSRGNKIRTGGPEASRLFNIASHAKDRHEQLAGLIGRIKTFLHSVPHGSELQVFEHTGAQSLDGESFEAAISRLRARIGDLAVEAFNLSKAPEPHADVKAQILAQVEDLAKRATPSSLSAAPRRRCGPIRLATLD
jgi:hypothetical protein